MAREEPAWSLYF